jgi:hypothetical protein
MNSRLLWVAAVGLLVLLYNLGAWALGSQQEPVTNAGLPAVEGPHAGPLPSTALAGNPHLVPSGKKAPPDEAAASLATRFTTPASSAAENEQLYAEARHLGRRIIPAIMAEVRRHDKPQWWACRACNALENLGVGAAGDIAGYLDDDHEEVRVIAATSLFWMGRETKNELPWQLLTRAQGQGKDSSGRVHYLAETARKFMAGELDPRKEVPTALKR